MNEKKYFYARVMADTNLYLVEFTGGPFQYGAEVVIKSEFGEDLAFINSFLFSNEKNLQKETGEKPAKKQNKDDKEKTKSIPARFLRYATPEDKELSAARLKDSREARKQIMQIAEELGLAMNITHILLPLKGNSMAVFYTAEGRVDFRDMLKILRGRFKERVIMRQIGARARLSSFALDVRVPMNKHRLSS